MTRPWASLNWYEPGDSGIVPVGGRFTISCRGYGWEPWPVASRSRCPDAATPAIRGSGSAPSTSPRRCSWCSLCVASMFVWAIDPAIVDNLVARCRRRSATARCGACSRGRSPTSRPSGPSSRSPSSGTSAGRSKGCSGGRGSGCSCCWSPSSPASSGSIAGHPPGGPRAGRARRVPRVHRRVPVRPVLLRHPGVGDRRRHRRHPGAAVHGPAPGRAASSCCS